MAIGIALEIMTTCPGCRSGIPLNALVQRYFCGTCSSEFIMTAEDWKTLLEDPLKKGPSSEVGVGQESSVFSSHNYEIMWGRIDPYFPDSKEDVDLSVLKVAAPHGYIPHPAVGQPLSVRARPEEYAQVLPGVTYLVGEDTRQLPAASAVENLDVQRSASLVEFRCPNCSASRDVDGVSRLFVCIYCGVSSAIPDPLWQRLHPVTTKQRWFIVYDESLCPYDWDGDIKDAVVDEEGRIFLATLDSSEGRLHVACLGADKRLNWGRSDLKYALDATLGTQLALLRDNRLGVWAPNRHSLMILSRDDGREVDKLGKKSGRQPADGQERFSLKNASALVVDTDASFLVWHPASRDPEERFGCQILQRFDLDGTPRQVWTEPPPVEPPKKGFFSKLFGAKEEPDREPPRDPGFKELTDRPARCDETDVALSVGPDGSVFLRRHEHLIRYSTDGVKCYGLDVPCYSIEGRVHGLPDGGLLFLCRQEKFDGHAVYRISPDGNEITKMLTEVDTGGPVGDEELSAPAPDGTIHLFGDRGAWRHISAEGEILYRSATSKEFEDEREDDEDDDD